jgi:hypothetical protein
MSRALRLAAIAAFAVLVSAATVSAQFMQMARCHQAYPCALPFGLQYRPDPLLAGPYTNAPSSAVSGHIELKAKPKVVLDERPPLSDDFAESAARAFVKRHPVTRKATPLPEPRREPDP